MQPGREPPLELASPARGDQPSHHTPVLHDHQRWQLADAESLCEIRTLFDIHTDQGERVVVLPPLESLRKEAFRTATATGGRRVEDD